MKYTDEQILELTCKVVCGKNQKLLSAIDAVLTQLAQCHETDTYTINGKSYPIEDVMVALMKGKEVEFLDTVVFKFNLQTSEFTGVCKVVNDNSMPATYNSLSTTVVEPIKLLLWHILNALHILTVEIDTSTLDRRLFNVGS